MRFKIGDKVRCIMKINPIEVGEIGTVIFTNSSCVYPYTVDFPSYHGTLMEEQELELAIDFPITKVSGGCKECDNGNPSCPICLGHDLDVIKGFEDVDFGSKSKNLTRGIILKGVLREMTHCFSCGEDFYTYEQSKKDSDRIRHAMVERIIELEDLCREYSVGVSTKTLLNTPVRLGITPTTLSDAEVDLIKREIGG